MRMEGFELVAVLRIPEPAIGQHAIDIKDGQLDARGALEDICGGHSESREWGVGVAQQRLSESSANGGVGAALAAMRFGGSACNCSCIAGIHAIHGNKHRG